MEQHGYGTVAVGVAVWRCRASRTYGEEQAASRLGMIDDVRIVTDGYSTGFGSLRCLITFFLDLLCACYLLLALHMLLWPCTYYLPCTCYVPFTSTFAILSNIDSTVVQPPKERNFNG